MTEYSKQADNTNLDRLVDGEMSADERREFLASLDERPEQWRRCALAFLEAQTWGNEFARWVNPPDETPAVEPAPEPVKANLRPLGGMVLAASLLIAAFLLGRGVRETSRTAPTNAQIAESETMVEQQLRDNLPKPIAEEDAVALYVRDASGKNRRLLVPLIEGENLGDQFGQIVDLSPELQSNLADEGLELTRRRRFAPLFFEQNERLVPMVVPVEDTYLVPVANQPL